MLLDRGFTVILVRHGSSPLFKVPDAVSDVRRAVRFARLHSGDYGFEPGRIGVFGGSAGGHLSLMLGTTSDDGNERTRDEVDRVSNRVAAVVAYFPPTDLETYIDDKRFPALHFDRSLSESVSPLFHVTPDDAPALLLHGGKDTLVPISHSEAIYKAFRQHGVPTGLIRFPEAGHGFGGDDEKRASTAMVDWFEEHLTLKGGLTGTWDAQGTTPDGDSRDSTVTFSRQDGNLSCVAVSERGEMTMDEIKIASSHVVMEKRFEREGTPVLLRVEASEKEPGKLAGTWSIEREGGDKITGDWKAAKRQAIKLAGTWQATGKAESGGDPHQVKLVFQGSGTDVTGINVSAGEKSTPLKAVKVEGKAVSFETSMEVDGEILNTRANAVEQEDGTLAGSWEVSGSDGQVLGKGSWTAVKE
jgi:dienelactone hydrolase